jgi:hypothetical protein
MHFVSWATVPANESRATMDAKTRQNRKKLRIFSAGGDFLNEWHKTKSRTAFPISLIYSREINGAPRKYIDCVRILLYFPEMKSGPLPSREKDINWTINDLRITSTDKMVALTNKWLRRRSAMSSIQFSMAISICHSKLSRAKILKDLRLEIQM